MRQETPCEWCKAKSACLKSTEYVRSCLFAWAHGMDTPEFCPDHEPDWYKGIEGVRR